MTLLIACILIHGFGLSPALYVVATLLWVGHLTVHSNSN